MTTEPTIPAAIIEKAARAEFERRHPSTSLNQWGTTTEDYRQLFRVSVARTLAPVYADIQAEAWEEGWSTGQAHGIAYQAGDDLAWQRPRNPYRADELDGGKP